MSSITTGEAHRPRAVLALRARVAALQESWAARSTALLLARLALAWVFIYHGAGKLFDFKHQGGIAGTTAFFHLVGVPAAHFFAYVVGLIEFVGGILLLIGLAAPLAALALAGDMLVAIISATGSTGMLPKGLPGGIVADGFEINLALGVLALVVAILGAGRFSADYVLGARSRRVTGGG
jgi:putative oxidoreductase